MKKLLSLIIVIALAAGGLYVYFNLKSESKLSSATLGAVLENASEVTTQKLVYTDVFESTSGKIPFINKNKFLVKYKTTIRAGFDASAAEFDISDNEVVITIPHCKVDEDSISIKANDIEFIDTNFSIIRAGKNDTKEAVKEAEERAKKFASKDKLFLKTADDNAVNILKGLFMNAADGRDVVVKFK